MSQPTPPADKKEAGRLKINGPRLITGTLAAVTGAALSSRLGVTGTLVGTAVISLVSGTMATVYEHSVERGRAAMRQRIATLEEAGPLRQRSHDTGLRETEATRRIEALGEQIRQADPGRTVRIQHPPPGDETIPYRMAPGDETIAHPAASGGPTIPHPRVPADETVVLGNNPTTTRTPPTGKPSLLAVVLDRLRQVPRRRWLLAGAGTLATFVLAIGIVTAIEVAHGRSLSGSSHSTTLGQAFGSSGHHAPQHPKNPGHPASNSPSRPPATPSPSNRPSAPATSATPSTTPGPSDQPTTPSRPQNSPTNSAPPTQTQSAPTQPTQTPSATQPPSPSNVPTPSATPSG